MTQLIPSEEELHAFVDERLAPARRAEVQAWLAANPAQAARLRGWQDDARRLRAALAGASVQSLAEPLDLRQVQRSLRQRRQRRLASAAVLLLAVGLGGLGGWQARTASLAEQPLPMADALQAHRLFARSDALDIQAREPAQLQRWLEGHFSQVGQLPDLSGYGLQPVGARLLSNEQGPAALLVFEDAQGQRISLFLRLPGEHFARMPSGQRSDGPLEARYWSHGAYNFALVSAVDDARGEPLRQALDLRL
ncbi:anti-sigma factor family protein [Pseudomonas cremoricolorata]|uniref:Transmembrane anti-sigma factor n=1 Tax=Pseudomonas cremoricolorata TaxID=157783 RepID=A0A089WQS3_9PSED|nr:anti-sigma factor [Pseudomonas cremoricolorata]AIR90931.1 transmembrane anti-sigma factor [Pseudomonas cremoricolorata]